IGGTKKMLVWNDLEADEKIKVYDRGVCTNGGSGIEKLAVSYRSGDMWAPRLEQAEALSREFAYFHDCIEASRAPFNDGMAGWRVVRMIEAATESLRVKGRTVPLARTGSLVREEKRACGDKPAQPFVEVAA
ncbi:MAG: hypothetical protein JO041_04015, partial [Acidobacteria bacterium]|nr:hypothetical protein [Acidobacteriota bacterium]